MTATATTATPESVLSAWAQASVVAEAEAQALREHEHLANCNAAAMQALHLLRDELGPLGLTVFAVHPLYGQEPEPDVTHWGTTLGSVMFRVTTNHAARHSYASRSEPTYHLRMYDFVGNGDSDDEHDYFLSDPITDAISGGVAYRALLEWRAYHTRADDPGA